MAMSKCRKCGKEVFRKETKCPYCGVKRPGERWWHGLVAFAVLMVGLVVVPKTCSYIQDTPDETLSRYQNTTLKMWRGLEKSVRLKLIDRYLLMKNKPLSASADFYKCMSQNSFTKNENIKAYEALSWCKQDYNKDPISLAKMVNFDVFKSNVRMSDYSYLPLVVLIKNDMGDTTSFKLLGTKYSYVMDSAVPYAIVTTTYQVANSYGGTVKNQISARVDITTGNIIEYLH